MYIIKIQSMHYSSGLKKNGHGRFGKKIMQGFEKNLTLLLAVKKKK